MEHGDKEPTSLSLDDYLDLLNLAIRLEDRKWQADIIRTLHHMQESQMSARYHELKATDDKDIQRKLLDQMWELKIARVEVFRKIRSIYQ